MALVLAATGVFVYLRFASELNQTLDRGLRSRASDIAVLVRGSKPELSPNTRAGAGGDFAEIIASSGRLLDSTAGVSPRVSLTAEELHAAARSSLLIDGRDLPGVGRVRILAVPLRAHGEPVVAVVGAATQPVSESLSDLRQLLLVGGPVALLLASIAAYGVAAAALRPVEAMRTRAAEISADDLDQRLPIPPTGDEIARLGHTLNAMLVRLAGAIAHERRFVADASHELRTPLAILKTELELAHNQGRSQAELEAAITSAVEETDRLSLLADDLLVIAQADQGRLAIARSSVNLLEVIATVADRYSRRAADHGRTIDLEAAPELPALADRLRVEQALSNLLDNALRYGDGPVTMTAQRTHESIELHVLDRGGGFSSEFAVRALERFTRAGPGNGDGGSGLGLAIVDAIAQAHGGRAHVGNRPGGGADVWLTLPSTGVATSTAAAESSAPHCS
jgi:two-component system, OmpR family, sensor kinase